MRDWSKVQDAFDHYHIIKTTYEYIRSGDQQALRLS